MNKFWNFKNEKDGRTLELIGEIASESWWGDEVTPKAFKDELNEKTGDITVIINSPGGDVFAASEIYSALRAYDGEVTVMIDALAASSAATIAMAGDEVKMSPTAYLMVHNPWTITAGNSEEMRVSARQLDQIKAGVVSAYQLKSGLPREKISQMMDEETYINAVKAVELGFADEVLYENEEAEKREFSVKFSQKLMANQILAKIRGKPPKEENKGKNEVKIVLDYSKYHEILNKFGGKKQ
jgi:ATP-dependent Clp protease protease subunit